MLSFIQIPFNLIQPFPDSCRGNERLALIMFTFLMMNNLAHDINDTPVSWCLMEISLCRATLTPSLIRISLCRATPVLDARWMSMSATPTLVRTSAPASMAVASSPASACQVRKQPCTLFGPRSQLFLRGLRHRNWACFVMGQSRICIDKLEASHPVSCQPGWRVEMLTLQVPKQSWGSVLVIYRPIRG